MKSIYFTIAFSSIVAVICIWKMILMDKQINYLKDINSRYNAYYKMLNQWIKNKAQNRKIRSFLSEHDINTIAIYGIGEIGQRLYEELKQDQLDILYFIDATGGSKPLEGAEGIKVIGPKEISLQEKVDAVIVTPIYSFESIYDSLVEEKIDSIILSLDEIIFSQK